MAAADNSSTELIEQLRAAVGAQYSIERLLGQGGMGAVFLARDLTLDRLVAIKVINPEVASNTTLRDRFLQEARSVAKLRHPNIVSVYAAGESNGLLFFVMEFVPGESLRELMVREGKLSGEKAEHIIRGIALALDSAHAHEMVHRDVKPENILLDKESGRAMLTDFGVARAFEKDGGLTQTGMILGSPRYMSPEQASGDSAIDGRSDLYSLALVAYEMHTGASVVQATSAAAMLVKHLTETPMPLAEKETSVPAHVARAIDRGLVKDPAQRWQTGKQFAEALSGHQLTPTGEVRGASAARRPAKRNRMLFVFPAIVAVAVALWLTVLRGGGSAGTGYLVTPFEIQSADASIAWLHDASVNMLTLTLGQWGDLHVVDYERTLSLLDKAGLGSKARVSLDDALSVARKASAGRVVMGQIQTIHDSMFVTAKLYDVRSGTSDNQARDSADLKADPRPIFDRLATKLLQIAGGPTSTVELAKATTTSIEAYRAYLNGVRLLNHWDLQGADTAFAHAIDVDSGFTLAYHKRSLALGWGDGATSKEYIHSADRAFELEGRLPPRERALIEGHYHLTHALTASGMSDTVKAGAEFAASIKSYSDLFTRGDTLVAEAWYGQADAYYHGRNERQTEAQFADWTLRALRGFNKTLAIDSTFHLAYSHLVGLYNSTGSGSTVLVTGDSVIMVVNPSELSRVGGAAGAEKVRQAARARGVEIARAWTRADPQSSIALTQLAQSYYVNKQPDSAIAVLKAGLGRHLAGAPMARVGLLTFQTAVGDTAAASTVRYVLDHFTGDSMREVPVSQRINSHGELMAQAAMTGRVADLDRAGKLFYATDSVMPYSTVSTTFIIDFYKMALRVAMGDSLTPAMKKSLTYGLRGMDSLPPALRGQATSGSISVPYLLYFASRDSSYLTTTHAWSAQPYPELDALAALTRHDTIAARKIAEAFPTPDSLRKLGSAMGGLRSAARAEVLATLGLTRQAAETYEAVTPDHLARTSLAEPGYTVWVRTWLARARLWAQLGERDKAVKAYEEFIRRWANADSVGAKQVNAAKRELAQIKDAPRKQ